MVGSQCDALNRLSFLPRAARELASVLTDPDLGGCVPALSDGPVLTDPSAAELDAALDRAFRDAAGREATLVLAFIGHGVVVDGDFYLMASDSPAAPDSRRAVLLGQRIKELLRAYRLVDGLVLLLDTCGSGVAAEQAGAAWIEVLRRAGRRFELLTATGDGPASGGCFTRSLIYLLRTGRAQAVDRLGGTQLKGPINELCPQQVATWTGFDGMSDLASGDPALWIGRNAEADWLAAPLAGTAFADEAYRLTAYYQPTGALAELHRLLESGRRCIVVTGAPHSGKSTLLAALTRPDFTGVPAAEHLVHAAVFLGAHVTAEQVAVAVADQLARTVPGFDAASTRHRDQTPDDEWTRAGVLERLVLGPLRILDRPVRIVVDTQSLVGLETLLQPDPPVRLQLVVATPSAETAPTDATVVNLPTPSATELTAYAAARGIPADTARELATKSAGNWTIATLLADQLTRGGSAPGSLSAELSATYHAALRRAGATTRASDVAPVLAVLAAAGHAARLPLPLLRHASGSLGGPDTVPRLHDALARLDGLVTRGQAGTDAETVGLVGATVATYLQEQRIGGITAERAHRALAAAIDALAPMTRHRPADPCHAYAIGAEAEHLWRCGDLDGALRSLDLRSSAVQATNRERWAAWSSRIAERLGVFHPLAIRARARVARWTAECGDRAPALRMLARLLEDGTRELGPTHRETLSIRDNIAYWAGDSDPSAGRELFAELVPDCVAHLGPEDPQTLTARHHLALMIDKCDDHAEAIRMWGEVLVLRERVIGTTDLDTLRTQHCLLYTTMENGYPPPVAFSFTALVATLRDTFGDDHPETLTARYHAALFTAKTEQPNRIAAALAEFRELLPEAEQVFGAHNAVPNKIREQLAFWPQRPTAG